MRDNPEFNIEFCEVVEKFPCLYDSTRSDYSNRSVQDKAWVKVGGHFKERVADCKDRWKNIRGRYVKCKHQKNLPSGSGTKRFKDYYLSPHLQFLDSHLKSRKRKGNMVKETLPTNEDNVTEKSETQEEEDEDNNYKSDEDFFQEGDDKTETSDTRSPTSRSVDSIVFTSPPRRSSDDGYRKKKRGATSYVNDQAVKYFQKKEKLLDGKKTAQNSETVDPDMAYLQSLLPDMKAMDETKKRTFKIKVLQLADQLLNTDSSEGSPSPKY